MGEDDGFKGIVKHYGKDEDWIKYNLYMIKAYLFCGEDDLKDECIEIYNNLIDRYGANNFLIQNQRIFNIGELYK